MTVSSVILITISALLLPAALAGLNWIFLWILLRNTDNEERHDLIGRDGTVLSVSSDMTGQVRVAGTIWKARLTEPAKSSLKVGDRVIVEEVEGLILLVTLIEASEKRGRRPL